MIDYTKAPGWFDYEEVYDSWAESCKDGDTFVEAGVFCGRSLAYLANKLTELGKTNCRLYGIDLFDKSVTEEMLVRNNDSLMYRGKPKKVLNKYSKKAVEKLLEPYEKCYIFQGDSSSVMLDLSLSIKADYIWIDADHTHSGVSADLRAAEKLLAKGGIIGGHDYGKIKGVTSAFDEFIKENKIESVNVGEGSLGLGNIQISFYY